MHGFLYKTVEKATGKMGNSCVIKIKLENENINPSMKILKNKNYNND